MASQFDEMRAELIAEIKANGRDIIVLAVNEATPADPLKPHRVGPGTVVQYPCKAIVSDLGMPDGEVSGEMQKNCIVPGDLGTKPTDAMRVQIGSLIYGILGVQEYDPDGTPIGWKLRLQAWPI